MTDTLTVRGLSDEEQITLNLLLQKLAAKARRNLLRSSYYDGRRAVKDVGTIIPPQYANLGLVLGWAAKGVDGLARRCNIDKFVWPDGDLGSLGFREVQDSNFLLSELAQARTDSLIHGVSYLITTQGDVDAGEPRALLHAKDALNGSGEWNARKRRLDSFVSITGRDKDKITSFALYMDGWTVDAELVDGKWQLDRSEHPWHVPVDAMPYHPRASRRMGRSRISRPVMGIQNAATRALIRLEAHMDIYAIPKLMLLGASEDIFKNSDGTMKPSWQIAMGRAFGIPDDTDTTNPNPRVDAKQFAAESPEPHLAQLNGLAKLMARETDLPDSDFAMTDIANPTSAESYEAGRENLIGEAEGAIDDWSVPIRSATMRLLAIRNGLREIPASWTSIEPKWRNPIFVSRSQAADAGAKQIGSVPWLAETEVGLELLGLDEQQIKRALAEKKRAEGRAVIAALAQPAPTDVAGQ